MKKNQQMQSAIIIFLTVATLLSGHLSAQNNPPLTVTIYDSSATTGYIFMAPYTLSPPYTYDHPQMILDRYGNTVYYRIFMNGGIVATTADFKLQPNGLMSFYSPVLSKFYLMDSTFTVTDSVIAGNGFGTDTHELQILSDGHYLILGREIRVMNLTAYHWFGPSHNLPGSPNAEVTGAVVQELDENKNVIFQWKAHDHFSFGDVDSVWLSSPSSVDWTHSNALERDFDGNILLSSRHLNEITKINRSNGNIMWRMGGKNNEFVFSNDTIGFTGQHDIRRLANGHVTLWDNGQYTDPPVGRALEYSLNETTKTATVEWSYIQDSGMYSYAMGNQQRLQNNDRFMAYGFIDDAYPMVVHVKPDSTRVIEIFGPSGYACYRAFNYETLPFTIIRPNVQCEKIENVWYLVAESGHNEYLWSTGATTQSIPISASGRYQVFVPYGNGGHVGSEIFVVTDVSAPCGPVVPTTRIVQNALIQDGEENCYDATQTIYVGGDETDFIVQSGGSASFIAGRNIIWYPGVAVDEGGYMNGIITTDSQFCSAQVSAKVEGLTGTEEQISGTGKRTFNLYPNPTSGEFSLETNEINSREKITVEIYTLHGVRILLNELPGSRSYRLSLENFPAGLFFVRIVRGGLVETFKLVKRN